MIASRSYLDHAATTPVLPEVIEAVAAQMAQRGNPSSLHEDGRAARRRVEEHRERLAAVVGARPGDVVLTASGTEADNLAVKGLYWARHQADPRRTRILISAVEHHAVLDPAMWLAECQGASVELLPVDDLGRVSTAALEASIATDPVSVALVSVMWANNEVGTVQPVEAIAAIGRDYGIPVHSDAVQVLGQRPLDIAGSGLDAVTLSGHKLGGPMGVGALIVRSEVDLVPVLHGGGQERDVRSGTVDAASVAGFALAVERAAAEQPERAAHVARLRDDLVRRVLDEIDGTSLNGDPDPAGRLPGNAHISFAGCEADALLMLLDARGVACSTGSACSSGVPEPSHVLIAMGDDQAAVSSLRFSLGRTSTQHDVDVLLDALPGVVSRARTAGRLAARGA
ncbi:MAG: cysteine desulfurase family protein [Jiangellales bacterium]